VSADRLEGLRAALELSPENHALRLVLAESLAGEGQGEEALEHYERLLADGALPADELVRVGELALHHGRLQLAARCLESARRGGVVGGTASLEQDLTEALVDGGAARRVVDDEGDGEDEGLGMPGVAGLVDRAQQQIAFADVGGLDGVKKAIHRTIVLPFQRPDLYERYGRRAGGGVMLYGPPGCGKTLLARATAGECGVPFLNLRIEDVLDPMYGVSERRLHEAFSEARGMAPCVLFIDELDAFAYARRKQQGSAGRALVDQFLQELDAIGSDNAGLLVLAATNAPWDVDDALKRPGRFDRVVFVSPPDEPARRRILELALEGRPAGEIDLGGLVSRTPLFSGADLRALVERAVDSVIDEALDRGDDVPITAGHLERAAQELRPTTVDWLRTARNYVEFANHGGRYDEVVAFLERPEARALRKR
jgi:AAA+ superfamily predicted ATPase